MREAAVVAVGAALPCSHVCRIDILAEGEDRPRHAGTGVLVGPTLVATAAHVVWPLVEPCAEGTLRAKPDTVHRISMTFGDFLDYVQENGQAGEGRGTPAVLHADWLPWASAPTCRERSNALFDVNNIEGITAESGPWDVALIRLAENP